VKRSWKEDSIPRISNWTKLSAQQLFCKFAKNFADEEDAIAHTVWIGNRLARDRGETLKTKFYSIKDAWLKRHQDCLVEGRIAREESSECRVCEGTGLGEKQRCFFCGGTGERELENDEYPPWDYEGVNWTEEQMENWYRCKKCDGTGILKKCQHCGGTGKYRSWYLYEHCLIVAGQEYTFHSYTKPEKLSDEPGEDCEKYGGRFSEEELDELALPFTGILKLLGYVAAAKWKLRINRRTGKYEKGWV